MVRVRVRVRVRVKVRVRVRVRVQVGGALLRVEESPWRAPVEAGDAARRGGGRQLGHVVVQVVERRRHHVGERAPLHAAALRQCQAAQPSA